MAATGSKQEASVRERDHLSQVGRVSRMGQVAAGLHEQLVEAPFGLRLDVAERNTLAAQPRRGERDEEACLGRALGREIGQTAIDELPAGERKVGESGCAEALADPTRRRPSPGDSTPLGRVDPLRADQATLTAVTAEALPDLGR